MYNKKIWFVRHGESFKNIEGLHGGTGKCLTLKGILECNNIASIIRENNVDPERSLILGHNVQQVIESMDVFIENLKYNSTTDERLRGIYLGVADGVSRQDLKTKFPDDASMLELWRKGEISVKDLKVNNMEDIDLFYTRFMGFLYSCVTNKKVTTFIVVCTTSILILVVNLIVLGDKFNYQSYYHYKINNGDFIFAEVKDNLALKLIDTSVKFDQLSGR